MGQVLFLSFLSQQLLFDTLFLSLASIISFLALMLFYLFFLLYCWFIFSIYLVLNELWTISCTFWAQKRASYFQLLFLDLFWVFSWAISRKSFCLGRPLLVPIPNEFSSGMLKCLESFSSQFWLFGPPSSLCFISFFCSRSLLVTWHTFLFPPPLTFFDISYPCFDALCIMLWSSVACLVDVRAV